jgi:hypothetical protein
LPGGTDQFYRRILAGPHKVLTRVEVWNPLLNVRIDDFGDAGVPFGQGSISATLTSRVARVCSLSFDRSLYPADPSGLLAPFGNYLKVYSGVSGYAQYMWLVFVGRINDVSVSDAGTMSLTAVDRAGDIQDAYFGHPFQSETGTLVSQQFKTLIKGALPDATFGVFDPSANITTPNLIWENDRASAADSLANLGNMFWYPLANGDFVMRQVAWTKFSDPLLSFKDGEGGTLLNWSSNYSRTNVANSIIVSGELVDGSTPVYGTAQDINPTSPTYIYGKYGVKTQFISAQGTLTAGAATTLANAYLRQAKALTDQWTMQIPSDPSLELGDPLIVIGSMGNGKLRISSTQNVSAFTLSLDSRDTMNVTLRAQVPGSVSIPEG